MIATLRTIARVKVLMYMAPLASDRVTPAFISIACTESNTAPMAEIQRVPTAANTKKVILKARIWFADIEIEP